MNIRSFLYGILISIFTIYSANSETRITYKSENLLHHIIRWVYKSLKQLKNHLMAR
jgi:hypothetical protein